MNSSRKVHPFDLQARAELAARSLASLLDQEREGLMYFVANWRAKPPRASHCLWDCGDGTGRHLDALSLLRSILPPGSPEANPSSGEKQLEALMLKFLGADGLTWLLDQPFSQPWGAEMFLKVYTPGERYAEISWSQRGTLLGLTSRFLLTGETRFAIAGENLVTGLLQVAQKHPDGLYFPEGYYRTSGWKFNGSDLYPGIEEYNAAVVVPSIRFYRATGFAPALELAQGLIRFALKHSVGYLKDGSLFPGEGPTKGQGTLDHFHTRTNFLLGVLETGILTGNRELISWARQSYDHAKLWGTDFGFFPEGMGRRHGETCCITDMIEAAILLGRHVKRSYYADAERFGRNHLLETQFTDHEQLESAVGFLPPEEGALKPDETFSTSKGVTQSQVGAFAARATLNDAFHLDAPNMMQCCNAAGARALYALWRYAIDDHSVHLRFSCETKQLKVVSHEPAEGRLDLLSRGDSVVEVRLPEGVSHAVVSRGSKISSVVAQEGYASFSAKSGETISLHYELPLRTESYRVGIPEKDISCTGHWKGETLMTVEPQGEFLPLYQRKSDLAPVNPILPLAQALTSLA